MTKHMTKGIDEFGQEIIVNQNNNQVMMAWEKDYMEKCIDYLQPCGDVLEVGFGLGYSSNRIQAHTINSHTIIEFDKGIAEKANAWGKSKQSVKVINDSWQRAFSKLGKFDRIFFDDYPLEVPSDTEKELALNRLSSLYQLLAKKQPKREILNEMLQSNANDRGVAFILTCLENHMNPGARINSYVELTESSDSFLEMTQKILSCYDGISIKQKYIDISVPNNCEYYSPNVSQALIYYIEHV